MRSPPLSTVVFAGATMVAVVASPAGAVLVDFTFGGMLEYVSLSGPVQVGDPFSFTVRFESQQPDLDASPLRGVYRTLGGACVSGNVQLFVAHAQSTNIYVHNMPDADRFEVINGSPNDFDWLTITFPPDTFASDALPLTLDLTVATGARLDYYNFGPRGGGPITSFSASIVPEPCAQVWLAGGAALLRARAAVRRRAGATDPAPQNAQRA